MNEMVFSPWTALDGELVFDFTINRAPHDGDPSSVRIACPPQASDAQLLHITSQRHPFELHFLSGCYVTGWLQQQTPVHIDGVAQTAIFADIHYGFRGQADDHHFEGIIAACPTRGPIPPPHPPAPPQPPGPPTPAPTPIQPIDPWPIIDSPGEDLFPYIYLRRWPQISTQDLHYGFVQYLNASPPSDCFFNDLIAARTEGREAMQTLALHFIDGVAPYQGQFIGSLAALGSPVNQWATLLAHLPAIDKPPQEWINAASAQVMHVLQEQGLTWDYLQSASYAQQIERVWQNYFALVIILGYDMALLDALTRTLRMAHVIDVILLPFGTSAAAPDTWPSTDDIAMACQATLVLPAPVFPLPPAQTGGMPDKAPHGWIEPYAIGDLQLVRQRLVRYQSGDIARIENVARGERRETTHKRTHRQRDEHKHSLAEMQILQNDAADERSNLQEESRKTVAEATEINQYNKFTSSYGPPTQATLDGSWSKAVQQGTHPGADDTTRFARDVLNKTVNRISRSVSHSRSSSTMSQTEDSVVSLLDNTTGTEHLRAVYRWLNKVYEACVVQYGQRLMMEFMVCHPAAAYIAQEQALEGQDFTRPLPPLRLGVASFEDIEPSGPRGYANLGAYYGVLDLEPPPLAERFASATVRSGEEKQIAIPDGYGASAAFVTCASSASPAPTVLVGTQIIIPGTTPQPLPMQGEDNTVPVSVLGTAWSLSPPSDPLVQVNVEIRCTPSSQNMTQWRIRTYAAIMRGYQERLAAYQGRTHGAGPRMPARSALACRQIEQRTLKSACMRLLLEHALALTGAPVNQSPPSVFIVNEPRYLQFLDEVLEWNEMSYSFYDHPDALLPTPALDGDALFANFLQAHQARVLLPVQPAHVMAFLYFYATGEPWPAPSCLAPAHEEDLAIVNDLHLADLAVHPKPDTGPCWHVVVPTAMQVIDHDSTHLSAMGGTAP